MRRQCARDMLQVPPSAKLPPGIVLAHKLRGFFHHELQEAVAHGTLAPRLYHFIRDLVSMWHTTTQAVEGMASQVKHMVDLAPATPFPLLSSRLTAHKAIARRTRGLSKREASQAQRDLAGECCHVHSQARDMNLVEKERRALTEQ